MKSGVRSAVDAVAIVTTATTNTGEAKMQEHAKLCLRVSVANQDEVEAGPSIIDMVIDTMAVVVVVATHERWRGGGWVVEFDMVCYGCMRPVHI